MPAKKQTPAQKIYAELYAARDELGMATIRSKQVAVLIRAQLKARWPHVKFSVTSDSNAVNVRWTDGPKYHEVDTLIGQYKFGGFDGMTDYAYSGKNWLHKDGTMSVAWIESHSGSAAVHTDQPEPGAILVKYGPRYVFAHRRWSEEYQRELAEQVAKKFGLEVDHDREYWRQSLPNSREDLITLMHRYDGGLYDD